MKVYNPYSQEGNWYKGSVHIHTTNSDGRISPQGTCEWYALHGYDFIAITDHGYFSDFAPANNIVCISGMEMGTSFSTSEGHLMALNIKSDIRTDIMNRNKSCAQELIDRINRDGGLSILAHPNIHRMKYYDYPVKQDWSERKIISLNNFTGMEIYNHFCVLHWPSGISLDKWDKALTSGKRCWGFAVDDTHTIWRGESLWGKIMVRAKHKTREDIVAAIKEGNFYASNGVEIKDVFLKENVIEISTYEKARIRFIGKDGKVLKVSDGTKDDYKIEGKEGYIRIDCRINGLFSWLQPFFIS